MAMIPCPECKKSVSEFAESCPKCGVTLTAEMVEKQKKDTLETMILTGGMSGAAVLFFGLVLAFNGDDDDRTPTRQTYTPRSVSSAPRTALGTPSYSRQKHYEDAKEFVLRDGRAAVRKGLMTKREFEDYTGVEY
ncbi:hypothetical protein NZK35_17805 [Stieleria sp. ICT_E10.1]|uniref:hypothetical protein n=1 Tax=Stieleria sedimenti TaxID=2976331 RepID=UPI00217F6596|nr:hypothetical protein [Stieleria sedimenti]MCS7468511.1 hypothetical protein [Stieleria sedimenti]